MPSLPPALAIEIIDACPAPLIVVSDRGRIMYVNQAGVEAFGYLLTEISGRPMPEVLVTPPYRSAVMDGLHIRARGESTSAPLLVEAQDRRGRVFPAELRIRALESGSEGWTLIYVNNLPSLPPPAPATTLPEADATKAPSPSGALQERKRTEEAIRRFAAGLAHHFSNLLTTVLGFSDVMLEDADHHEPPTVSVAHIREIRRAALRGSDFTRDLHAIAGTQLVQPGPTDLNLIAKSLLPALRQLLGAGIDLHSSFAPTLGKTLGDASVYGHVVMNLTRYARDASGARGKVAIETANLELPVALPSRYGTIPPGSYVTLRITYSNVIPPEAELDSLFEPFARGTDDGLGLASVYGTLKQLGAFITMAPSSEVMTSISVYFPRLTHEPETQAPAQHAVLLCHRERGFRQMLKLVLEQGGYRVTTAEELETVAQTEQPEVFEVVVADPPFFGTLDEPTTTAFLSRIGRPKIMLIADAAATAVPAVTSLVLQRPFDSGTLLATIQGLLTGGPAD
ncbi:MAG TPA: PAS domain S-box protein, partial [Nitrospirales bacterium]|nr:PAS domain S-box protein [Nitrospirales bacterium]